VDIFQIQIMIVPAIRRKFKSICQKSPVRYWIELIYMWKYLHDTEL